MKYSQYPYKRIKLENLKKNIEKIINQFNSAKSSKEQIEIIQEYQKTQKEIQTFANIASLNFARDTKDRNTKEENEFYDTIMPEVAAIDNKFTKAVNMSKFKNELLRQGRRRISK